MKYFGKVNSNYRKLTDNDFLSFTQTVALAMTDNPNFESPSPSLEDLYSGLEEYAIKLAASNKRGSPEDTQIKNEARIALEKIVSDLAYYVNRRADGSIRILLSSGLRLSKPKSKIHTPNIVTGLVMRDGRQRGQMVLSFDPQKNARLYWYMYTDQLDASGKLLWTGEVYGTSSSRYNVIAPVKPASIYYIKVCAINSESRGDWSAPICWIAR